MKLPVAALLVSVSETPYNCEHLLQKPYFTTHRMALHYLANVYPERHIGVSLPNKKIVKTNLLIVLPNLFFPPLQLVPHIENCLFTAHPQFHHLSSSLTMNLVYICKKMLTSRGTLLISTDLANQPPMYEHMRVNFFSFQTVATLMSTLALVSPIEFTIPLPRIPTELTSG